MAVADSLAAHPLGEFFCNFSAVQKFCRFFNIIKAQQNEKIPRSHFILRRKNAYNNNIIAINEDPNYLNGLDGLPPDLAHDLFEGFAVDIVSNVIVSFAYSESDKNHKPQLVK